MMGTGAEAMRQANQAGVLAACTAWSLAGDIRWGAIDVQRARAQADLLRAVRRAALAAAVRPVRVSALLQTLTTDVHGSAVCSLDLYDGLKHFHALRVYLETVEHTPAISDGELAAAREAEARETHTSDDIRGMVAFLLMQHLSAHNFRRLGAQSEEPVLAEILELIAADEIRHARCMSEVLRARIHLDSDAAARVNVDVDRLRDARERRTAGATGEEAADDFVYRGFARSLEPVVLMAAGGVSP